MWSRRLFLRHCVASSAGLVWTVQVRADEKPEAPKPDSLLTPAAQKAILSGLKYLKDRPNKDGSFGTQAYAGNVAITSLCGLALLSGGHRPGVGAEGTVIDSALDFVLGQQDPRWRGFLNNPKATPHGPMYNHGFAMVFLSMGLGSVQDKKRAEKVREVLSAAVALTLKSQNSQKGWRYLPSSQDGDLTVTSGQLCALRTARDAGIGVPRAALVSGAGFIKKCHNGDGGFRYMPMAANSHWSRTAAGLLALYSAGVTRGKEIERGLAYLLKNRPDPKAVLATDMHYYYGHYNAALATWAAGGDARKQWYTVARDELSARQNEDGSWKDVICSHYATAMALLALQAPNGFLSPEF